MSDIVSIGKIVIDWLLSKNRKRTAQIEAYLQNIKDVCTELVEIDDPLSEKAALLHHQLKIISDQASERLPRSLIDRPGWNLYRGLMSARIYYWLRVVDFGKDPVILQEIIKERHFCSSPSFDAILTLIPDSCSDLDRRSFVPIREQCLNDIANIMEIEPFFKR